MLCLAASGQRADGVHGDEQCQREEGDCDDPQGQVLAPFRVFGGELRRQGDGGGDLDHRIKSEADEGGGARHIARPECDDDLNEVMRNRRGREQPDPPARGGTSDSRRCKLKG
jgi:hypothetical protein